ncbi:hypothetical protein FRC18_002873 [Serendipita sp. 400]|nr:hypothetical protein FRC18_002873 [Serendipita sp. 400]
MVLHTEIDHFRYGVQAHTGGPARVTARVRQRGGIWNMQEEQARRIDGEMVKVKVKV